MSNVPRVTLDTNGVIGLLDWTSESATSVDEIAGLFAYAMQAKVEIAITTRGESDLSNDTNDVRRRAILRRLATFPVVSSIGRWDVSGWDQDAWPDDRSERHTEEIQQILFPGLTTEHRRYGNMINDVDHLVGHMVDRRDIFVTDDTGMLTKREALQRGPGIVVMSPAECLAHIDGIVARARPRTLPSEGLNPAYHARELRGAATFDYTNNDGRYAIGEGEALFDLHFGANGNGSVHAMKRGSIMNGVAIAQGASEIAEVRYATEANYSSWTRSPRTGQIVLWQNVNGLFAAIKIGAVLYEPHGADRNEMTFEYVILPDGSADFGA